jgi:hypothetical protein
MPSQKTDILRKRSPEDRFAGNGGLSLRRVSAIRRVLAFQERFNDTEAEDEWYGKRLWVLPGEKVASGLHGVLSVEDVYIDKAMGYHVRDGGSKLPETVWKDYKQRKKIFAYCPELALIMDMKLERERCLDDNKEGQLDPQLFLEQQRIEEETQRQQDELRAAAIEKQEAARKEAEMAKAEADNESASDFAVAGQSDGDTIFDEAHRAGNNDEQQAAPSSTDLPPHAELHDDTGDQSQGQKTDDAAFASGLAPEGAGLNLPDADVDFSVDGGPGQPEQAWVYDSRKLDGWRELAGPDEGLEKIQPSQYAPPQIGQPMALPVASAPSGSEEQSAP